VAVLHVSNGEVDVTWVPMTGFPQYRTVSLAQFEELEAGEDRFKVILRSPEEATRFYAHSGSGLADEAIYAYASEASVAVELDKTAWLPEDILRRYIHKHGLPAASELSEEDLVAVGKMLGRID